MRPSRLESSHPHYPAGLTDLEQRPDLYLMGHVDDRPRIAIVGTRRATTYGFELAGAFGSACAKAGWTVVSGLARGIDAQAHRGCLAGAGHGVAVLGSGVDVCYPRQNQSLYEKLLETGGAVLSEYPPGTPPDRWRFPARNRIIAAMSGAVVVVEAAERGGALITARFAAEIGRPVFVVPGDVDRPTSRGCNLLIRDGAHPVLGVDDLIAEASFVLGPPEQAGSDRFPVPDQGIDVEHLPGYWGVPVGEALVELGRLEANGVVRRSGQRVVPAR